MFRLTIEMICHLMHAFALLYPPRRHDGFVRTLVLQFLKCKLWHATMCNIPVRKYMHAAEWWKKNALYFFSFSRSNLHLSTSVRIILFLHLFCHVCFWCCSTYCWCFCTADINTYRKFLIHNISPIHFILTHQNHYTGGARRCDGEQQ